MPTSRSRSPRLLTTHLDASRIDEATDRELLQIARGIAGLLSSSQTAGALEARKLHLQRSQELAASEDLYGAAVHALFACWASLHIWDFRCEAFGLWTEKCNNDTKHAERALRLICPAVAEVKSLYAVYTLYTVSEHAPDGQAKCDILATIAAKCASTVGEEPCPVCLSELGNDFGALWVGPCSHAQHMKCWVESVFMGSEYQQAARCSVCRAPCAWSTVHRMKMLAVLRDFVVFLAGQLLSDNMAVDEIACIVANLSEIASSHLPVFLEVSMTQHVFTELHAAGHVALDKNERWMTTTCVSTPCNAGRGLVAGYGKQLAPARGHTGSCKGLDTGCTLASLSSADRKKTLSDHDLRDARAFNAESLFKSIDGDCALMVWAEPYGADGFWDDVMDENLMDAGVRIPKRVKERALKEAKSRGMPLSSNSEGESEEEGAEDIDEE